MMTNSVRTAMVVVLFVVVVIFVGRAGVVLLNKLDLVLERVVELRREHNRLCTMYSLFGPLKEEGIRPETFPFCRSTYETMMNHTRGEKGLPNG